MTCKCGNGNRFSVDVDQGPVMCNPNLPEQLCPGGKSCPQCGNPSCLCATPGPPGPPSPPPHPPSTLKCGADPCGEKNCADALDACVAVCADSTPSMQCLDCVNNQANKDCCCCIGQRAGFNCSYVCVNPCDKSPPPPSGGIPKIGMNIDNTTNQNFMTLPNSGDWYDDITIPGQTDKKVKMVRVFASGEYNQNWKQIINWCVNNNIYIFLGIYIRGPQDCNSIKSRIDYLSSQYLQNKRNFDKYVVAISVGNECERELGATESISRITCGIEYCRYLIASHPPGLPNKPVTTTFDAGLVNEKNKLRDDFSQLIPRLDFISCNLYPWFAEVKIENALETLKAMIAKIRKVMNATEQLKNKELWLTETGWAWTGNDNSTQDKAKQYYTDVIKLFTKDTFTLKGDLTKYQTPNKLFYFAYNDAGNEHFGLEQTYS